MLPEVDQWQGLVTDRTGLNTLRELLDQLGRAKQPLLAARLGSLRRDARPAAREVTIPASRVDAEGLERERLVTPGARKHGGR